MGDNVSRDYEARRLGWHGTTPPQPPDTIDQMVDVRCDNNAPWFKIWRIALRADPVATKAALRQIYENDKEISRLLEELIDG